MQDRAAPETPELTVRAVVLGLLLSVVMGAANVYVGLKAGMTVSASIPAAVTAMIVLRTLFKRSSILEANQVQTAASAGESLAAGIIFTMPALILVGYWKRFDFWTVTLVALAGGMLGILFMIPMRRVFVTGRPDLPYPEGVACAKVLEAGSRTPPHGSPAEVGSDALPLIAGTLVGAAVKALVSLFAVVRSVLETAFSAAGRVVYLGADVSPMLVAVGLIVRLNVAVLIFLGGSIGWLVAIPILSSAEPGTAPLEHAWTLWSTRVRYIGVGAMIVGGAHSIFKVRHGLVHAVRELSGRADRRHESSTERDLSPAAIIALAIPAVLIVAWLYYRFTGSGGVTLLSLGSMLVMGFFFTAVASYIVGLVGNSNSPVSGMTITAVLFTGLLLSVFGYAGSSGMVAILGVAAVVCCIACTAGDVCNDLKTGSLVGATPARQQIMQILGVFIAAFVMAPVLGLLHSTAEGGIGGRELPAPQAALFASLTRALAGRGELPMDMVEIGAALGVLVVIVDTVLERRGSPIRAHLMPIAVGIYLPFGLAPPILLGGLLAHFEAKKQNGELRQHRSVLFASGIIAGESLTGIALAALAAVGISSLPLHASPAVTLAATLAAAAAVFGIYHRVVGR